MRLTESRRMRTPRATDVRHQLSEADAMLGRVGRSTSRKAGDLLSQVEARLRSAADTVQGLSVDRARAAGRVADDYVSDNPWRMVGVAAVIGLLAGMIAGRR
jgi:ElaB/YqjD/DUF883 family membrane-anchored ribosome-binding protein